MGRKISLTVRQKEGVLEIRADGHFIFGTKAAFTIDASQDTTVTCSKCKTTEENLKEIHPLLVSVNEAIETLPEDMSKTDGEFTEAVKGTQASLLEAKYQANKVGDNFKEAERVLNMAKASFVGYAETRRKLLALRDKGNKLADMAKKE